MTLPPEILEQPPEEEGDDTEAGGGKPTAPITEGEVEDTDPLEEDDYEGDDEPDA